MNNFSIMVHHDKFDCVCHLDIPLMGVINMTFLSNKNIFVEIYSTYCEKPVSLVAENL